MIAYLIGKITYVDKNKMILENNYKGIWINLKQNHKFEQHKNKITKIFCYKYYHNNYKNIQVADLYGFQTISEKEIFTDLINISGIGPKIGLTIMQNNIEELKLLIGSNRLDELASMPGITKKIGELLIKNLQEKYKNYKSNNQSKNYSEINNIIECKNALKNLGYNNEEIQFGIDNAMQQNLEYKEVDISDFISYAIKAIATKYNHTNQETTEL